MNPFSTDSPSPWIIRYELEGSFGYNFALVLAADRTAALNLFKDSLCDSEERLQYSPYPRDVQPATQKVLEYILTARPRGLRLTPF